MSTPILATKLYIPPPRPQVILRPSLIERLNQGLASRCKVILISAPAGFGKTTLVSEWIAGRERLEPKVRVAWLSLDEGDSDPARFLVYLVAALQTFAANVGQSMLGMLQSPQPPPTEAILTTLLNEIAAIPDDFILVLDDYHAIDAKLIDQALSFLLEHQPPQMRMVIATREDPHLPLAQLRVRGQLTELRVDDLRFVPSEATEFLNQVMGLKLLAQDIAALGKALVLMKRIGFDVIQDKEQTLTARAIRGLAQISGLEIYGIKDPDSPRFTYKGGVIVFGMKDRMADRVAKELAEHGIGVRYGCHCAHLLIKRLLNIHPLLAQFQGVMLTLFRQVSLPGVTRVSLGIENSVEDVDALIRVLGRIAQQPRTAVDRHTDVQQQIDEFVRAAAQNVYAQPM